MNHLLYMRIHLNKSLVQVRKLVNKHLRIKRHRDKERSNATLNRHQEDVCNLKANEESERHDDGSESVSLAVIGLGTGDVEIGEEGADVGK